MSESKFFHIILKYLTGWTNITWEFYINTCCHLCYTFGSRNIPYLWIFVLLCPKSMCPAIWWHVKKWEGCFLLVGSHKQGSPSGGLPQSSTTDFYSFLFYFRYSAQKAIFFMREIISIINCWGSDKSQKGVR